jgi:IS30 family transposase
MSARERRAFSEADVEQIWCGWRAGQSQAAIARSIGRVGYGVWGALGATSAWGGIAPVRRSRAGRQLSLSQREEISRGLSEQVSMRRIARRIGALACIPSR